MKSFNFKFLNIFYLILIAPFIIGASSCEVMTSQRVSEIFEDGRMPRDLSRIQSQVLGLSLREKEAIIRRVEADKKRPDLIKVAVIDSGVDLIHPDLQRFLDYKVEDGKIVGVGYDFMSDRPFGTNVFFDATLFAWGADKIRNGKIVGTPDSPLQLINNVNEAFRSLIIDKIKSDPELKHSLFRFLTKDAFTVFGLMSILDSKRSIVDSYNENKSKSKLINESSFNEADTERISVLSPESKEWSRFLAENSTEYKQRSKVFGYLERVEGGLRVFEIIESAYKEINEKFDFQKNFLQTKNFIALQNGMEINDERLDKKTKEKLISALDFIIFGASEFDPILNIEKALRNSDKEFADLSLEEILKKYLKQIKETKNTISALDKKSLTSDQVKAIEIFDKQYNQLVDIVSKLHDLKSDPKEYQKYLSNVRKYAYRAKHPYIASETLDNIHATHVAGTIGYQLPDQIRIIPIRVTTQSIALHEDVKKENIKLFLEMMDEWSKGPYYEKLKQMIMEEYGLSPTKELNLRNELRKYLEKQSLNVVFIKEVFQAIEKVGELGAHFANVSLGTVFKKGISKSKIEESIASEFFSEFVRFKMGELLKDKASKTIFFIATGNDGAWVDNISKVAFPAGIRSPRLETLAQRFNLERAPNNVVENIVPVASVNAQKYLTEFANMFISGEKIIGSTGQEVMAPTPRWNNALSKSLVSKKLGKVSGWLRTVFQLEDKKAEQDYHSGAIDAKAYSRFSSKYIASFDINWQNLWQDMALIQYAVNRQELSGTSMATPSAVGRVVGIVSEYMKQLKLKSKDLYVDSRLSVTAIRKKIFESAKDLAYEVVTPIKVFTDDLRKWKMSKGQRDLEKTLKASPKEQLVESIETTRGGQPSTKGEKNITMTEETSGHRLLCRQLFE